MRLIILSIIVIIMAGCKNNSNKTNVNDISSNVIKMKKETPYIIEKGDELQNVSNPIIELDSNLNSGKTIAILKSGEANIIKK